MAAGSSSKSLSPARAEAARKFLSQLVTERYGGNASAAARALGVSQAQLSDVLSGTYAAGTKVLEAAADLTGVPIDVIIGRLAPPYPGAPLSSSGWSLVEDEPDEVPERAAAVRFARANGWPEAAIERVRALPARPLTPEQWYERIKVEAADLGLQAVAPPRKVTPAPFSGVAPKSARPPSSKAPSSKVPPTTKTGRG